MASSIIETILGARKGPASFCNFFSGAMSAFPDHRQPKGTGHLCEGWRSKDNFYPLSNISNPGAISPFLCALGLKSCRVSRGIPNNNECFKQLNNLPPPLSDTLQIFVQYLLWGQSWPQQDEGTSHQCGKSWAWGPMADFQFTLGMWKWLATLVTCPPGHSFPYLEPLKPGF